MICIEKRTLSEIAVGELASLSQMLSWTDIRLFAAVSGDVSPSHMDEDFPESGMFHKINAHGMWGSALISTVLGTQLPEARHDPCPSDPSLPPTGRLRQSVVSPSIAKSQNQRNEIVIEGTVEVVALTRKICLECSPLPEIEIHGPEGGKPAARS